LNNTILGCFLVSWSCRFVRKLAKLGTDVPTLVALVVCLIPTTIGALFAADLVAQFVKDKFNEMGAHWKTCPNWLDLL
jgi:high-affinity K+ transport system ATPase subunit B